MPNIEVRGKYRTFRYDGDAPLDFTPYNNSIFLIRRPNPTTFVTLQQYVPGQGGVFTTFQPGSSYTIVTNADGSQDFNFDMGPYTRVNRLPSSTIIQSPNFYIGLDKNSIAVPISSYALSVNKPLSSIVNILYINGQGNRLQYLAADSFRTGAPVNFTHFLPNSGYELRTRIPFTFFAPLQSEMGDAYALGNNSGGEYGMGYRYSQTQRFIDTRRGGPFVLSADQTFGIWDKIVFNNQRHSVTWNGQTFLVSSLAALSSHGTSKALFVLGSNLYGQLGTGSSQQYYPTWTRVPGQWKDIELGAIHMLAINSSNHLYACGSNQYGQLGLGSGVASVNTLTLVDSTRNYVQLAATTYSTSVRDINGAVYSCGDNSYGQLGIGSFTTLEYALTREATNYEWDSIKTIKNPDSLIALKDNELYGCGKREFYWGGGDEFPQRFLKREILRLTDITDFYTTGIGTFIKRQGQDYLFAAGNNDNTTRLATISTTPQSSSSTLGYEYYFIKTTIPSNMRNIFNFYISNAGASSLGYIGSDFFVYSKSSNTNIFTQKQFKAFDAFSCNGGDRDDFDNWPAVGSPVFLLNYDSNLRPTPTPTLTPTPTPTLTPSPTPPPWPSPDNVLQVGIFGSNYPSDGSTISQQNFAYNSPGNLNNVFTLNNPNAGYTPPGKILSSTFDYEKGNSFNNIVGIGVYVGNGQGLPANRYNPRYIYKKIGSTWTYTLLPANMDAMTTGSEQYSYTHGCDTLLITPQHPFLPYNTSQGIYNLIFVRDKKFKQAVSFDRGVTWDISGYRPLDTINEYTNSSGLNKVLYSRSRGSNYTVCSVMVASNRSQIYFGDYYNFPVLIYTISNINGFNFIHDYKDIPTVVFSTVDSNATGAIYLTRRINGSWQTVIVKQNIIYFCLGPDVLYPADLGRINSSNIGLEVDPTNSNLIYIAYLRSAGFSPNFKEAVYINVLCYNTATNSVVFDESVVRATKAQGSVPPSIHTVDSLMADVPTLFYDKTNNSLNLFFVGQAAVSPFTITNYRMSRFNDGSWSAPTSFTTGTRLSNNNELRIKY